jgi:hypothetical protein
MNFFSRRLVFLLLPVFLALPFSPKAQAAYSQSEIERLLQPVALYPDALLRQVLRAATRPLDVMDAAYWARVNPRALETMPLHPSVRALAAHPQVLQYMDQNIEWTRQLGEAFFTQEPQVMATVQLLRQRAYAPAAPPAPVYVPPPVAPVFVQPPPVVYYAPLVLTRPVIVARPRPHTHHHHNERHHHRHHHAPAQAAGRIVMPITGRTPTIGARVERRHH